MVIGDRLHTLVGGIGSPLVSARDADVTRPIVDKFTEKQSEDSTSSDETEGDTPVSEVEVMEPTEESPTDSDVETPEETITRKGEEALDQEDDDTGTTY